MCPPSHLLPEDFGDVSNKYHPITSDRLKPPSVKIYFYSTENEQFTHFPTDILKNYTKTVHINIYS